MVKSTKVYAVGIDAGNDRNGNPRRGWYIYTVTGSYLGFLDEGFYGYSLLKHIFPNAVELTNRIPVKPAAYSAGMKERIAGR